MRTFAVTNLEFPRGGNNPGGGVPTYYLADSPPPRKLHQNEEILGRGRVPRIS